MSIRATQDGYVAWVMTPNRARKIAALLRAYTRAFSEATRIDIAERIVAALTTPPSCACGYPDRHTNLPCSERRDVDD